jgi:Holliday junction DNA helicase RuvA
MIAHISGLVTEKFFPNVIVDVNGIGYEITLSSLDYDKYSLNDKAKIYTYHYVREQEEQLFGFPSLEAKKLFELLISVQGVGPKAGMSILSLSAPENIRSAIAAADAVFIAKASGIGKRSAERIIVDLRDKVGLPSSLSYAVSPLEISNIQPDEALEALIALGLNLSDATKALESVDKSLSTEQRIKLALQK